MKWLIVTMVAVLLAACSAWETHEHASELSLMRQDDETCIARGYHFPDQDYVSCRYKLQDDRAYYAWKCMQMTKCPTTTPNPSQQPFYQTDQYKPLDEEHFRCWKESQFGGDYVYCGVKQQP